MKAEKSLTTETTEGNQETHSCKANESGQGIKLKGLFSVFEARLAGLLCALSVLCGSTCCFERASHAAEPRLLTLDQAIAIAGDRNRDIQLAREFYRQVEGKYVEERAAALPQLTLTGQASWQADDSQRALAGGLLPTRQDVRSAELGLSQALFTWGKVGAAIRAAEKGYRTADERLRIARHDVHRQVAIAFYDILLAREQHAIARQNMAQKERHLDEAQRRFAAGVATDYDVLAASVSVENARPEVIRSENQVRSTKDRLRYLLALDDELEIRGSLDAPVDRHPEYADALALARQRRPELAELRQRTAIADDLVTIANAEDKPRLDLKGGYGWRQLEVGDARGDGQLWSAGVFLSFPLFDGLKARGKVAQAESDRRSLAIDEAKLVDAIALEIRDALSAVRESAGIVSALTGTTTQAERLLVMAEKGFEFGVKIRLEVEDAELNLRQAQSNLARARRDYLAARVNLDWTMGTLGE